MKSVTNSLTTPNDPYAYVDRGHVWCGKGEYDRALADYHRALAVDPKYAYTYAGLAWLQATCPNDKFRDGKEALENAHKASQLNGSKDWRLIGILAAAYAESGDFDKAKEWEAKAIELAATDKSATAVRDRERFRSSLELYKQGKPYREEAKKK